MPKLFKVTLKYEVFCYVPDDRVLGDEEGNAFAYAKGAICDDEFDGDWELRVPESTRTEIHSLDEVPDVWKCALPYGDEKSNPDNLTIEQLFAQVPMESNVK